MANKKIHITNAYEMGIYFLVYSVLIDPCSVESVLVQYQSTFTHNVFKQMSSQLRLTPTINCMYFDHYTLLYCCNGTSYSNCQFELVIVLFI